MVICIFAKFNLIERERPPMVIFLLDVVYNWPNKLPQKSMDEKSSSSVAQNKSQQGAITNLHKEP
jgi:hypothetical protein